MCTTSTGWVQIQCELTAFVISATPPGCWTALVGRNPGQEARAQELESDGLSKLVYNPGGIGSRLKGTASLVVTNRAAIMGRAMLILPYTAETGRELGLARRPLFRFNSE